MFLPNRKFWNVEVSSNNNFNVQFQYFASLLLEKEKVTQRCSQKKNLNKTKYYTIEFEMRFFFRWS